MLLSFSKYLLFANLFLLQSSLLRFQISTYPTNLQEILIGLNFVIFLLYLFKSKKIAETLRNSKNHRVIIIFILLSAISLLTVEIKEQLYLLRYLKFLFFGIILSWIFLETLKNEKDKILGLKVLGLGAISFGLFSLIYNLLGFNVTHDYRLTGPLDAAVYLAFYLSPFLIFFSYKFIQENPRHHYNLYYALTLAILLLLTRSMGALAASFLVIFAILYTTPTFRILKNRNTKIILAIVAIVLGGTIFYSKILPAFQTNYSSLNERGEIWQTSFELLKKPKTILAGLGPNQFQHYYETNVKEILGREPLDYIVLQPHNLFLFFIFNFGLLGLIVLLSFIIKAIANILNHKIPESKKIASFMLLYLFVHGLIDTPFLKNDLFLLLILLLELATMKNHSGTSIEPKLPSVRR